MLLSQGQSQQQIQKIAPHLIQASEMLRCTSMELLQTVERELVENPALETSDSDNDPCMLCPTGKSFCSDCPLGARTQTSHLSDAPEIDPAIRQGAADADERASDDAPSSWELELGTYYIDGQEQTYAADEAYDPLASVSSLSTLTDHLMSALRSMCENDEDLRVVQYLVSCLDERGWLAIKEDEALEDLGVDLECLNRGIARLQSCDPAGIGARDLRECLLLQLRSLAEDGSGNELLTVMVEKYWDDIVAKKTSHIARRTRSTIDQVDNAMRFLQTELSPDPAGSFRQPWEYKPDSKSHPVRPEVIIRRTAIGFDIEVVGGGIPSLHVNERYRVLYQLLRSPSDFQSDRAHHEMRERLLSKISAAEQKHIVSHVERANLFLKNIDQRRRTIEKITRKLIETQQGFIETGSRAFLRPMTRTELAQLSGMHESTVSRALLRKFVQLPNEDVIPFDDFFAAGGSIKDMIMSMVAAEDPRSPLTDEKIRQMLTEAGNDIARRTVVKYRESLRIPPSYLRRKR